MSSFKLALGLLTLGISLSVNRAMAGPEPPTPKLPPLPEKAAINTPGPMIEFASIVHDFGKAKSGEPVKYTYYFTNTGDQVLEVTHVQPSCGCTTAGDYSRRVEPGKTGTIPIQFNTANFSGQVFKTIAVTSTARNLNAAVLKLQGTVWKPIEFLPAYSVLSLPPDVPSATTVVRITNNVDEPLVLFEPHCTNPSFTTELVTNVPGKGFELTISAHRPLATGTVQAQVTLKTTSTNTPNVTIPFWANVQPAVMVFPAQITLPPAPLTAKATPTLTIQNNSTNQLSLSEAAVNIPDVTFELKETQPGRVFSATFNFPEGFQTPQGQQVVFTAKSSNPQMPLIKVPILQMPRPASPPTLPVAHTPAAPAPQAPAAH